MPQTPARRPNGREGARSEGEFADLFARKAHTPLRGFLPGRRVWNAVGASAAAALVIAGSTAAVAAIDWSDDPAEKVTTAADEAPKEEATTGDTKKASAAPFPKERAESEKGPNIVYVPVSGGGSGSAADTGAGTAAMPGSDTASGSSGSTGATTGSTGSTDGTTGSTDGTTGSTDGTTGSTDGTTGSTGSQEQENPTSESGGSRSTTGFLWSDGNVDSDTNDYWDQSTVTVETTASLTSLKVVVSIAQTGGVANTGIWSSLGDKVTVSSASDSGRLAYVVTLKSGNTIGPGTYSFKFQYDHAQGGRDAGGDRYNVTATTTGSATEYDDGGF